MNKVILMGRLTRNPEIRYSQNDSSMSVVRFTLAVDRRFKRDNEATADFISCVAFGKTAEFMSKYTSQGTKLCVEGRIQTGSYQRPDGQKVYTTDVVVENVEFAESKGQGGGQQSQVQQNYGGQQYQQAPQYSAPAQQPYGQSQGYNAPMTPPMQSAADEGFMQIPDELTDEGLPFN